jgi:hypothetical protein
MKTHTIEVKAEDWKDSKYRTREWEKRVDIARWEHHFDNCFCKMCEKTSTSGMYYIIIRIK